MINSIIQGNVNTTKLIQDLKNSLDQYPPLSKDDELRLIDEYRDDEKTLKHLLFMHNIRLVFNIAKKYAMFTPDFDNIVQDGMLGLAIAADKFDVNRKIKFITYATPWIKKKILENSYSKNSSVLKNAISMNTPVKFSNSKSDDSQAKELTDCINSFIDPSLDNTKSINQLVNINEQNKLCAELYSDLNKDKSIPEKDKKIFMDLFYNKESTKLLYRKYNIDNRQLSSIKNRILNKMKKSLKDKHNINSFSEIYDF